MSKRADRLTCNIGELNSGNDIILERKVVV
jgi:hypothetical protein